MPPPAQPALPSNRQSVARSSAAPCSADQSVTPAPVVAKPSRKVQRASVTLQCSPCPLTSRPAPLVAVLRSNRQSSDTAVFGPLVGASRSFAAPPLVVWLSRKRQSLALSWLAETHMPAPALLLP